MSDTKTHTAYTRELRGAILAALADTPHPENGRGGILTLTRLCWAVGASEAVMRAAMHRMLETGLLQGAGSGRPGVRLTRRGFAAHTYTSMTAWLAATEGQTAPGLDVARTAAARCVADAAAVLKVEDLLSKRAAA